MQLVAKLLFLFTVVPLVELYLLLYLGTVVGFWPTVGIVAFTGVVGAGLAKHEGLRVWRKWQESLAGGAVPEDGVVGGLLVLIGGVLLVTPGVLTDLTGFLLLIPPTRKVIADVVRRRLERGVENGSVQVMGFGGFPGAAAGSVYPPSAGPTVGRVVRPRVRPRSAHEGSPAIIEVTGEELD